MIFLKDGLISATHLSFVQSKYTFYKKRKAPRQVGEPLDQIKPYIVLVDLLLLNSGLRNDAVHHSQHTNDHYAQHTYGEGHCVCLN